MAENNNNSEFKVEVDKEELKNQTKETVNQVKETVKNINFKEDANATKGFILELISKPFTTIKNIVTEKENNFSSAVILMICYIVISFAYYLLGIMCYEFSKFQFMPAVKSIISPVLYVLAFTIAVFLFGGKDKKNITTIISGIAIAVTPLIVVKLLSGISLICVGKLGISVIGNIVGILNDVLKFASVALMFVAIKNLITSDDEDKVFRKVIIIVAVGYAILEVLSLVKIY